MERIVTLHIEKLPEGLYLATSDDVQGLIAQGRTIQETIEIARDVAKTLIDLRSEPNDSLANTVGSLPVVRESFDYPLIINA
jgi:predicted RNase H-like HicB family nuclease